MNEQEKKRQKIYDLLNTEIKTKKHSKIIGVLLWSPSNPDIYPLNDGIWGVLENNTNATYHLNIGLLKTTIEGEWNKMSEEFILKAYKSFRRHVATIIEKIAAILSKFTVMCLSFYFVAYFLKLKLILFYNIVFYY